MKTMLSRPNVVLIVRLTTKTLSTTKSDTVKIVRTMTDKPPARSYNYCANKKPDKPTAICLRF